MENTLIITGGILLGCLIGLSWFAGTDAPYVATKNKRLKKLLKQVGIKKGDIFWELGSGDGRVVLEAAKLGANGYGIEQSWIRVFYSRWQAKKLGLKNARFIHGNIFDQGYSNADLVFIFLLPKGVERLEPLLQKKLKKGSRVITQTFHFKNWQPVGKILITDKHLPNQDLGKNQLEGDFWIYKV